jgi:N utilization substance protein A
MAELHGEKIDIVDFSEDPAEFVANALSPARVTRVDIVDPVAMEARVVVPDYQLSLAIGKEGQNARLAARLTGWRIDIRSDAAPPEPLTPAAPATSEAAEAAEADEAAETAAAGQAAGAVARDARAVPQQARDAGIGAVSDNAGTS